MAKVVKVVKVAKVVTDSWVMAESKDVTRSVAFYAKLGLRPSMRMPYYAEFKIPGGTVLGLHSMETARRTAGSRSRSGGWSIMLRVKDIKKVTAGLRRRGVRCTAAVAAPGGALFSRVADPDGNRLTLIQMGR
jgi:predicted enzyme related to lactoylglutathione lyase